MKHIFIFICLLYVFCIKYYFCFAKHQNFFIFQYNFINSIFCKNFIPVEFILKSGSHFPKKFVICLIENYKKCFLFHLKSSFRSKYISVFVTTFWPYRKSGLIRKTRLTSEFMTSQSGLETIAIHILPNISQSIGNQTIKFGQLIKYNEKYFSSKIMQKTR